MERWRKPLRERSEVRWRGSGRGRRRPAAEGRHGQDDAGRRRHREALVHLAQQRAGRRSGDDEGDGGGPAQGALAAGRAQSGVGREAGQRGGHDDRGDVPDGQVTGGGRLRAHGQGE